ncbi:MAG: Smr/MutS family protein [Dehalococcoidia bacterium]|nr:Endonuclease MutS2 [Chloroflexota bacterium]MBT9160340.1 Endonuclease MutS2 [Chloroflexota bacterium]MBT9162245.1 Endonuclease MutS2 [Chloroflexota bacterium]
MIPPEPEVMLRRLTVEDALIKLDQYLNDAFTAGLYSVRIVHGKGTGTLRLVVCRELARHPLVESFRPADPWEGGLGVTIAQLVQK